MINIKESKISLRTFTKKEYHRYLQPYVADPVMDPNLYVYDNKKVDENYDSITKKEA